MTIKLDFKDRKILYELDKNSRQSNAAIAKKVGISKQVVGFRLKRLAARKVITYYTIIDIARLGFTAHKIFLRLQDFDAEKERALIKYLQTNPNILWAASCDGKFDFAFSVWAKNMEQLDDALKEFSKNFGESSAEKQMASIIRGDYFVRDYLVDEKIASSRPSFFGSMIRQEKIDEIDSQVLFELGKSARVQSIELAQKISVGAGVIAGRIKRLEKCSIIQGYNIVPNESQYPYLHYKVLVGVHPMSIAQEKSFAEYCKVTENIVYLAKTLGPWEFEIDLEVESAEQFRRIMMNLKTQFKEIIKDYSALHIYQVHKYCFCPSIPEQEL